MISALFYLQACSGWNRILARVRRLKKPKYLVGLLFGGVYFYFFLFRYGAAGSHSRSRVTVPTFGDLSAYAGAIELLAALVLMMFLLSGWILPHERAALAFSESEAVFLFSAPISRRTLVHFKLLKSQVGILVTTLFMFVISNRFGARGSPWLNIAGWWIILATINLHFLGASFVLTRLLDAGWGNRRRRLAIFGVLAIAAGAILYVARDSLRLPSEAEVSSPRAFANYLQAILGAGPAPWLLYPFRLIIRPYLSREAATFLSALGPALLVLVLHYVWVIRSTVAFEEATLAMAQKRAKLLTAARHGQLGIINPKARRGPFNLNSTGPAPTAFLWKNLIAAGNLFRTRSVVIMLIVLVTVGFSTGMGSMRNGMGAVIGVLVAISFLWSVMLGPLILRYDFRSDLRSMDALKLYPLAGWRVVLGELLAPVLVLSVIQWLLLVFGVIGARLPPGAGSFGFQERLAVACGLALVAPMLNLVSFLIPNATVLLFPTWFQPGQDQTQGIEVTGQRLIFGLGQFAVFLVALVPAGIAAGIVVFILGQLTMPWTIAVPVAAVPAALVLGLEAAAGIALLGRIFEKFDLSSEPPA
ncbi:MAG: hypothetical protein QOF48_3631 [Verrucomicrobiota bacterium]|jgi:hypothetical protein